MNRTLLLLALMLPAVALSQDATKDTTFYISSYELMQITFKRPLLKREYPQKDTSYKVLLFQPIRIVIKGNKLMAGKLGTYTIVSHRCWVYHKGSDGDDLWDKWNLKNGNQATVTQNYFILSVREGRVQRMYNCEIIHRPGT